MSWLSKWWKNGGRETVRDTLVKRINPRTKAQALDKLRMMLGLLDRMDLERLRTELVEAISYVEGL